MAQPPQPLTLAGKHARLEPLEHAHGGGLFVAGRDPSIWTWLPRPPFADEADLHGWIADALRFAQAGAQRPFAIIDQHTNRPVGSTRFLDVRPTDGSIEIGWTWLALAAQRTAINTECKLLLLTHAFDELGYTRVQLKTDIRNERSQRAIERLGAVREGILRKYQITRNGFIRDTVMYSIIRDEWPTVKQRLSACCDRPA